MSKSVTYICRFTNVLLNVQVYVIGGDGILDELQLAGFTAFGGPVSHYKQ